MQPNLYIIYKKEHGDSEFQVDKASENYLQFLASDTVGPKLLVISFNPPPLNTALLELAEITSGILVSDSFVQSLSKSEIELKPVFLKIGEIQFYPVVRLFTTQYPLPENLDTSFTSNNFSTSTLNNNLPKKTYNDDIRNVGFSYRTRTVFKKHEIHTLSQLVSYSDEDLLNLKNLGRKSLSEIKQFLKKIGAQLEMNTNQVIFEKTKENLFILEDVHLDQYNFLEVFTSALAQHPEHLRYIVERRSGMNGIEQTLDEIGNKKGVTRERIRQLELRAIMELRRKIPFSKLEMIITNKISEFVEPMLFSVACTKDILPKELETSLCFFKYVSKWFFKSDLSIIQYKGLKYLSVVSQDDFNRFENNLPISIKPFDGYDIEHIKSKLCPIPTSKYYKFFPILFSNAICNSLFIEGEYGKRIMKKFFKNTTLVKIINEIVLKSEHSLTNEQLEKIIHESYSHYNTRLATIRMGLLEDGTGVYPLSVDRWGTVKHIDCDLNKLNAFYTFARRYVRIQQDRNYQFHSRNLHKFLSTKNKEKLTFWHLTALMREMKIGHYLGRNVFGSPGQTRITVQDCIVIILKRYGKPMPLKRIRNELKEFICLPDIIQFRPILPIVVINHALWSLEEWNYKKAKSLSKH